MAIPLDHSGKILGSDTASGITSESYDVSVLGKLLLVQSTLNVMPDNDRSASFLIRGLAGFPGVDAVGLFFCGKGYHDGRPELFEEGFAGCKRVHKVLPVQLLTESAHSACPFAANKAFTRLEIRTSQTYFGCCVLHVFDTTLLDRYRPFLENTISLLSILTENRDRKAALELYNARLEDAVRERTKELEDDIAKRSKVEKQLLQREHELSERNQFVESLVNVYPDIIYLYDIVDRKNVYSNEGVSRILGYTPQEVKEMGSDLIHRLMDPDDFVHYLNVTIPWYGTALDGEVIDHCYRMQHKKGTWRWLSCREVIFKRLDNGNVRQILGVIRDITAEREAQEQVKNSEQTMRQVEKMQAIGQLAGGIAHDFNNQLAGIIGYADLLREMYNDEPTVKTYAEKIITVTRRAAELTAQLLMFGRKGKYLAVDVDINGIIGEVASILRRTIDRAIKVTIEQNDVRGSVWGDPTQIQNAIMNLALNARDAMTGEGVLTISTSYANFDERSIAAGKVELIAGKYIRIDVSDTGTGIDEKIRQKIFEPFFTTKDPGKGTGMGLASVYGTVKNHGGAITVDSTMGKGTCMSVFLPAKESRPAAVPFTEERETTKHSSGKILLVDDDEYVIDTVTEMLSSAGYTVTTAVDGLKAIELFKEKGPFDLVILDMIMPGKNGRDTLLSLREINAGVKVVISSGYAPTEQVQELITTGACFIQKPYRKRDLIPIVEKILQ